MFVLVFGLGFILDIDVILKKMEPISPTGEHLVLDLKGVETEFLKSEKRLVKAIADAAAKLDLHLLSCNCFSTASESTSCFGTLPQAQISLQAWPESGVVALDVFHEGPKSLLPVVDILKETFEIGQDVQAVWSIEYRGDNKERHFEMSQYLFNSMVSKVKKKISSVKTRKYTLDIWETLDEDETITYDDAIAHKLEPDDPRWHTNDLARVTKSAWIDRKSLTSNDTDAALATEPQMHPALIVHPNPKHVAIGKISLGDKGIKLVLTF
jgi:S-adenosylmethionine/arginine decarboxylase-like enzyme